MTLNLQVIPAYGENRRLAGDDRYSTAAAICREGWQTSTTKNAILATGENFPDALCAAPLSYLLDAPILLTEKDKLNKYAASELVRLDIKTVYIIGGIGVISAEVEDRLKELDIVPVRIAGSDRYETSVKIAEKVTEKLESLNAIVITTGEDFPDALSIAPIAAARSMPMLLMPKDYIPECIKDYLAEKIIAKTFIVGPTDIISEDVEKQLSNTYRFDSTDKYERNLQIIRYFDNINVYQLYIATGENYPDALAGSALAAKNNGAIILTNKNPEIGDCFFINDISSYIHDFVVFGGTGAVSQDTFGKIISTSEVDDSIDAGTVYGTEYKNDFFGLKINLPVNWYYLVNEIRFFNKNGTSLICSSMYDLDAVETCFLEISAYGKGSMYKYDSCTENLRNYANLMLRNENGWVNSLVRDVYTQKIGDMDFKAIDIDCYNTTYNLTNHITFYGAFVNGYFIFIDVQYNNTDEKKALDTIINSISFM